MASLNSVALVGNLTKDPELRSVGDTTVLSGRLAFSRREKKGGEWVDTSGFVDVTLGWGNRADALERILRKGSRIGVTGELRYREWEKDGQRRSTLDVDARDVMLLDSKQDGGGPRNDTTPITDDVPF